MKKIVCITLLLCTTTFMFAQQEYAREWKQIDSLLVLEQPQSAGKIIDRIYQEAQARHNAPQVIKAHLYRFWAQGLWNGEVLPETILYTETAIDDADEPVKSILHSIVADYYWRYYHQNRWQLHSRNATGEPSDDIRTWDISRLVEKCIAHYSASLTAPEVLQNISTASFNAVLEKHPGSRAYRPTLYDLLAFRAIEFYGSNLADLTQPQESFSMADARYFAPAADFSALPLAAADTLSFTFQALKWLQQAIAFHLPDPNPAALIDADLQRLDFVHAHSVLEQKDSLYLAALQALGTRHTDDPASAEILFRIAKLYDQQGQSYDPFNKQDVRWKKKEAVQVLEQAVRRFPDSFGAKSCLALQNRIRAPHLLLTAHDALLPGKPGLASLQYKNVSTLYYKIIPLDVKEAFISGEGRNRQQIERYAKMPAAHTGQWVLPDSGDYQTHTVEQALPALREGYYSLLVSTCRDFSGQSSLLIEKRIWATRISYTYRTEDNGASLLILHRQTGQPLSGVQVTSYSREYDYNKRRPVQKTIETLVSDDKGMVTCRVADRNSLGFHFVLGTDRYASPNEVYLYPHNPAEEVSRSATLFTDRAIYRPGQTLHFKGIVLAWENQQASIVPNARQTVALYNVQGEKISDLSVITNDFGSFSGSFTIPSTGLTGSMSLRTEPASGYHSFNVEEYKRPKFEVRFEPVGESHRLGEEVKVSGRAMMYAGNALSDAKVSYRIVRQARYPYWRWWTEPQPSSSSREIGHGEALTRTDGTFHIPFTAIPDAGIDKKDKPVFHYTIYASVSDVNGETHEAQTTIPIGYQSLLVSTNIPEKVNACRWDTLEIHTTHLNGRAQPAQGTVAVWKLRQPDRVLLERRWPRPDQFALTRDEFEKMFPNQVYDDENNASKWEKEQQVYTLAFNTREAVKYPVDHIRQWPAGTYWAVIATQDAFGEPVRDSLIFTVFSPLQKTVPVNEAVRAEVLQPAAQPGDTVAIALGSALDSVRVFYELRWQNKASQSAVILLNREQKILRIPVEEKHRGNIGIRLFFVKDNRSYNINRMIAVPYEHKKLHMEFASFRNKLLPGAHEEWRITVKDNAGDAVAAELLASMYDASLDSFTPHIWHFFPWQNNRFPSSWDTETAFRNQTIHPFMSSPYISFPVRNYDQILRRFAPGPITIRGKDNTVDMAVYASVEERVAESEPAVEVRDFVSGKAAPLAALASESQIRAISPTPSAPPVRARFNETAFFYPHLRTNDKGEAVIGFTVPEALTRWKMQGLAWTRDIKTGYIAKELVTQKELMIFSNPPRFFRENDTLWFSAKLSNLSDQTLEIQAEAAFFDALTMQPISHKLLLEKGSKTVRLASGDNRAVFWNIRIPEGLQAITYRITAAGNGHSDGEEGAIPVLTNRMLVTESLPLPIRSRQVKSYTFDRLLHNQSKTLSHHSYTVEFTSNPAWSAVQALPYMMEYPYDCAEQAFSRYYANAIATHIVQSDPKIRQVFDIWRNYQPNVLQSNLEKNPELASLLLEETPWVRAAQNERERKQRMAALFDLNRMAAELASALQKVAQAQTPNGGFAWFKGGRDDRYMTQHIVAGIGHLQKMGIRTAASESMLQTAVRYMDIRIAEEFHALKALAAKEKRDYTRENHLSYLSMHYLYARSFFTPSLPVPSPAKEAFDFYVSQAVSHWNGQPVYLKGMLALALHRYGQASPARLIMQSLSETATHSDETGMYWKNAPRGWWWYQAPVETHALMIEAYHEILNDRPSVEELKIWLLKQKQTTDWKTTKATSEAVYALLLIGENLLANDALCEITVGGQPIDPNKPMPEHRPEAGTGYFKTSWTGAEVQPKMGRITVRNPNPAVAWGAAYWQYFEQLDHITPAETGVSINKQLFVHTHSPAGPVLKAIAPDAPVTVGDKITVRMEVRTDRDMEYVHLKDMRAAAFEPVNVLSGYRWQDGIGYYESTRDAATNFFISYLPKGTYVFEYELFATQRGEFSNGITSLQCMYAPEFTAHSQGLRIRVEP